MPYITEEEKINLDCGSCPITPGQLSYLIFNACKRYLIWQRNDESKAHRNNYQDYNDVLGAIEGVKQEFYRRIVAPYEDKKCKENGDII